MPSYKPVRRLAIQAGAVLLTIAILGAAACGRKEEPTVTPVPTPTTVQPTATSVPTPVPTAPSAGTEPTPEVRGTVPVPPTTAVGPASWGPEAPWKPYLMFNQKFVEGVNADVDLDMTDIEAVFWHIFSSLPAEITVYPSENYFYFILYANGTQYWGNIRLPSGRRERGVVSFAYFEFIEFPSVPGTGKSWAKYFTDADGITVTEVDPFAWDVRYGGKTVRFHLNRLRQDPPKSFELAENEAFIERTLDESGLRFFLMFNTDTNYFFWVLNEEEGVADTLDSIADDIVVGKRSGFAFWVDSEHQDRKVLATIRSISVTRNDYYDGPFDQLADNYVDENKISEWMIRAYPALEGRIDKYGYYTDTERSSRVAISAYGTYYTQADIITFIERAKASDDVYRYMSRGGVPVSVTPTPEADATPSG